MDPVITKVAGRLDGAVVREAAGLAPYSTKASPAVATRRADRRVAASGDAFVEWATPARPV